jgi:hypothetical protein
MDVAVTNHALDPPGPDPQAAEPGAGVEDPRLSPILLALVGVAVAAGIVLRFVTTSHLWLDEALSVNIARLPLSRLPGALRHDGSPPLYYALLHVWMSAFGTGDVAVRALSGVLSVAALPLMWVAGQRLGGRKVAAAALVLLATSPFAIRFATETRMYSLLILLVLAGFLCLLRLFERPSLARALPVSLFSGLVLLTHYWTLYLLAVATVTLFIRSRRRGDRQSWWALGAIVGGGLFLVPWVSVFLFQTAHTGTPWAMRPRPGVIVSTLQDWSATSTDPGQLLFLVLFALVLLGLMGSAAGPRRVELDLRTRPGVRSLSAVCLGVLVVAMAVGAALGSAYVVRYTSVVFPMFVLAAAFGAPALGDAAVRRGLLAVAMILGLGASLYSLGDTRTEAGLIAAALRTKAAPASLVVYCPDQLGPAVSRLLPPGFEQLTFPSGGAPQRVDWVDYAQRNRASHSLPFAHDLVRRAGDRTIYLVWAPSYRTYGTRCQALSTNLSKLRPHMRRVVTLKNIYDERMGLIEFRAG